MITIKQNSVFLAFLFILMAGIMSCKENVPMDLAQESIIPKPVSIMATNSSFKLEEGLSIYVKGEAEELNQIGQYLAKILKSSTDFEIEVQSTDKEPGAGNIYLTISDSETELGEEGYELIVTENLISLNAD
ncbi:MAG: beta-N-acetylhexosaminidase, partial [Bacteroidetes bacterium]